MATTTVTARGMVSVSVVETVHGTEKKPRSAQHWEEIARSNTQKIAQLGTNVPLAWVLVQGKNIPPNAIIAGEDKRRPLYVARTFWEGGVHIGQAGQHLERGASFAYNGKEIHVDTYEVLVPLQQTITYHVADCYHIPSIPRITHKTRPIEATLDVSFTTQLCHKLRAIKVVIVIDDSDSMEGQQWNQARSALTGLVSIIESDIETNGIDLCFLNNPTFEVNIRNHQRIENIFDSVRPQGATPTGKKLRELFGGYLPLLDSVNSDTPPTVIMVITDGVPTDNVEDVIIDGARHLDRNQVSVHRFGLSFVQIGNDPDAAEFLRELDEDISHQHNCRDMVNTTPYDPQNPEFTRDGFLKCVLGSIDPYYDSLRPHLPQKIAPRPSSPLVSIDYGCHATYPVSPRPGVRSPPTPLHFNSLLQPITSS
ncbi:hypothetical protein Ac2012v2_001074 [Leucoagaricus gongylophorus]